MFERYTIKNGDTLFKIANDYSTSVDYLKDINNLYYTDNLREGTEIIVPKEYEDYFNVYTIEKGDSLYKIAQKYNINPELLSSLNGIDMQDYIYPNQEILIPKANYSYYITKSGDTLSLVADKFNIPVNKMLENNQTIYLQEGQILVNKKK